jgi:hypothetical protein
MRGGDNASGRAGCGCTLDRNRSTCVYRVVWRPRKLVAELRRWRLRIVADRQRGMRNAGAVRRRSNRPNERCGGGQQNGTITSDWHCKIIPAC